MGYRFGSGCVSILKNSPAYAFAYWVMTGVTDLDLGVMGILNYSPTNAVAYWVMDGITDPDRVCWGTRTIA